MAFDQGALTAFLFGLVCIYLVYWYVAWTPVSRRRCNATHRRQSPVRYRMHDHDQWDETEHFEENGTSQQAALDFSDVLVTDDTRAEATTAKEDADQIQTVNERFNAAKRKVTENKLTAGVYNSKQRRKLVETLLRRPQCARRIRSWRQENSDYLRGDVQPRASQGSTNLMRSAKSNPEIDLHPGALGPLSGMQGRWLSEEGLPGNVVPEGEVAG